ncbi:MAG: Rieske 2Fe-2S domain-containing protein [Gammaproteobacteria bacterium]|nr:Rieske 2Fe-2S domain-containing protein [Gammaproteobacteria bacterium]
MSRAYDYLLRERPRALGAWEDFQRDAGSRLEPATRALIELVTAAAARGDDELVRAARAAREADCSAEELVDALLLAVPALGFTRIAWALDRLIEHGLSGALGAATPLAVTVEEDLALGPVAALPQGRAVRRGGPGRAVLAWRDGDEVRAFKAYCTHHGMELTEHCIEGRRVTCRQHGWTFELPDGRCSMGDAWGLTELPVTIESGQVSVRWSE